MEQQTIRKFQSILAAADIPINIATAEVILGFAKMTIADENPTIDGIREYVDEINSKYISVNQDVNNINK